MPCTGDPCSFRQRVDDGFVQARAGLARAAAQGVINIRRDTTNGVLHAFSIGSACMLGKHSMDLGATAGFGAQHPISWAIRS